MFQPFYVRPRWEAPAIWREQHNNIETIRWKDMRAVKRVTCHLSVIDYQLNYMIFLFLCFITGLKAANGAAREDEKFCQV